MNRFFFVVFVFFLFSCNNITSEDLVGFYVNTNYDQVPFLPDIPYISDTLELKRDGSFYSDYWGKGTYSMESSVLGSSISLNYKYEFGLAGMTCNLKKEKGIVRIVLDDDRNHYYRKVN